MQGGVARSVYFLVFLLYVGEVKAKQNLTSSEDLKTVVAQSSLVDEESKSGALAESLAYSDGGSSQSEALAESSGGASEAQSLASSGDYGSNSAKVSAQASAQSGLDGSLSPYEKKDPYRLGFSSGPGSAMAKAEAHAQANSGLLNQHDTNPYQPRNQINLIYPYGSGQSAQALTQAQALTNSGEVGSYNARLTPYQTGTFYSPGSNSAQAHAEALAKTGGGGSYNPGSSPYQTDPGLSGDITRPISPLSPGSSSAQASSEALTAINSGTGGSYSPGRSPYQPGYKTLNPYNQGSSYTQAQAEAEALLNNGVGSYSLRPSPYQSGHQPVSPYSPDSSSAQAQAQAQALVKRGSGGFYSPVQIPNLPEHDPHSPYNSGLNSAEAQAELQAFANMGGGGFYDGGLSSYQPGYQTVPPYSLAQAEGLANSAGGGSSGPGLNPYQVGDQYPLFPYGPELSSAQAQAEAQALANSGGSGFYRPGLNPQQFGSPYNPGTSTAQAQAGALALANSGEVDSYGPGLNPNQLGNQNPLSPYSSGSSYAHAEGLAQSNGGPNYSPRGYPYNPGYPGSSSSGRDSAQAQTHALTGGYGSAEAAAQAQAMSSGANSQSSAFAVTDVYSRLIPLNEYIRPHLIPGIEKTIVCAREGELHNFWSSDYQCLVCACVKDLGYLRPVCASCSGCIGPIPEPTPMKITPPLLPPPPPPQPQPQVSCSPLPSGQLFQNPLNPCQICICKEIVNSYGAPDVEIDCQENPECVLPPDVATLSPIPDAPVPTPLPMCDKFPQNVMFPHPTDVCKICKCNVEMTELGVAEPRITCMMNPECLPRPVPAPEPITQPPPPIPIVISPVSFPDIVTPEPLHWPSATTPAAPGPGPLPGPSPHESCRPFTPNQPFQHPWDECQLCVCTEAFAIGHVTVEINCYTKKSCCFENSYDSIVTVTPASYDATPAVQIIDQICEYKSFGVEFAHPQDTCNLCTCELQGNLIKAVCKRSPRAECALSYSPGVGSSSGEAYALANTQTYSLAPQTNALVTSKSRPSPYIPYLSGSQGLPSGEPGLLQQTNYQPGYQLQGQSGRVQSKPGNIGGSQIAGDTTYLGQYQKPSDLSLSSGYSQYQPGYYDGNLIYPMDIPYSSSSLAEAEAVANVLSSYNQYQPYYTGGIVNYPGGSSLTKAQGLANILSSYDQHKPMYFPGSNTDYLGSGSSSALANAEALANTQSNYNNYHPSHYPDSSSNHRGSALSSATETTANGQSGLPSSESYLHSMPASSLYPSLYPRQSYEITPLYQPGKGNFDGVGDSSQAQALAESQGSNVQAKATANAGGGFRTKSAEEDVSDEITEVSTQCQNQTLTTEYLLHLNEMKHVAAFKDAQHRGPRWYDEANSGSAQTDSDLKSDITDTSSSESTDSISTSASSEASSEETKERRRATQVYRSCTPCPKDMLKKHKNIGIKWICGGYQRARRSFKSECMMRYRNCQDGTLFVKIYDHRCKNDSYHGRHWFYVYSV